MRYGGDSSGTYGGVAAAATFNSVTVRGLGQVVTTLAQSATPVTAPVDLNENILGTITVPANALGASGALRIRALFTQTNNANNKTYRIRFSGIAGTIYITNTQTTGTNFEVEAYICNRTTATQVGSGRLSTPGAFAATLGSTSAVDTTVATTVVITALKATAGDTITLESYTGELLRP